MGDVIDFFSRKVILNDSKSKNSRKNCEKLSMQDLIKLNKKNEEKIKKERAQNNKRVIKSNKVKRPV